MRPSVSPATAALQEQIMRQDAPYLEMAMQEQFGVSLKGALKAASNYQCRREASDAS